MKASIFIRWIWFNVYSLSILIVPLSMLFKDMSIVALYLVCSSVAAYITFISANYVLQSNELFQKDEAICNDRCIDRVRKRKAV